MCLVYKLKYHSYICMGKNSICVAQYCLWSQASTGDLRTNIPAGKRQPLDPELSPQIESAYCWTPHPWGHIVCIFFGLVTFAHCIFLWDLSMAIYVSVVHLHWWEVFCCLDRTQFVYPLFWWWTFALFPVVVCHEYSCCTNLCLNICLHFRTSQVALVLKEANYHCRRHRLRFNPWVAKIPWRREWPQNTVVKFMWMSSLLKSLTVQIACLFHFH